MSGSVNLCVKLHSKLLPVASLLCHQHCADLIFIRSQAHSILLPTDTQPLSKRLKFARTHHPPTCCNPVIHYNKVCPLLWATSLHCWVKEPVSASSGLYTEPKGVMTHSNEDSVLLDPFFFVVCTTLVHHLTNQEGVTLELVYAILPLLKSP